MGTYAQRAAHQEGAGPGVLATSGILPPEGTYHGHICTDLRAPQHHGSLIARHRAETEQAIAEIRFDASLDDRERARRITQIVAEANGRVLGARITQVACVQRELAHSRTRSLKYALG